MLPMAVLLAILSGCTVFSLGSRISDSFMQDDDPALVGEAMPVLLKAAEIMADSSPRDVKQAVLAASLASMYAAGFVSADAAGIADEDYEARVAADMRAKALFLRGFQRGAAAIDLRVKGTMAALRAGERDKLRKFRPADVPLLYWTAAGALGAFSLDPFDPEASRNLAAAVALLERGLELDADWNSGSLHELVISLAPSLPVELGGGIERAQQAYEKALKASGGLRASPHVSYATSVTVGLQDHEAFQAALERALAVDLDADPAGRLANRIAIRNAERLLGQIDRYFLILEDYPEE